MWLLFPNEFNVNLHCNEPKGIFQKLGNVRFADRHSPPAEVEKLSLPAAAQKSKLARNSQPLPTRESHCK